MQRKLKYQPTEYDIIPTHVHLDYSGGAGQLMQHGFKQHSMYTSLWSLAF